MKNAFANALDGKTYEQKIAELTMASPTSELRGLLHPYAVTALINSGYDHLIKISLASDKELLEVYQIGPVRVKELRKIIADLTDLIRDRNNAETEQRAKNMPVMIVLCERVLGSQTDKHSLAALEQLLLKYIKQPTRIPRFFIKNHDLWAELSEFLPPLHDLRMKIENMQYDQANAIERWKMRDVLLPNNKTAYEFVKGYMLEPATYLKNRAAESESIEMLKKIFQDNDPDIDLWLAVEWYSEQCRKQELQPGVVHPVFSSKLAGIANNWLLPASDTLGAFMWAARTVPEFTATMLTTITGQLSLNAVCRRLFMEGLVFSPHTVELKEETLSSAWFELLPSQSSDRKSGNWPTITGSPGIAPNPNKVEIKYGPGVLGSNEPHEVIEQECNYIPGLRKVSVEYSANGDKLLSIELHKVKDESDETLSAFLETKLKGATDPGSYMPKVYQRVITEICDIYRTISTMMQAVIVVEINRAELLSFSITK